ncbi:hypothetical protein FPZ43_03595 [Mucilaginibacter pallidiroseus]|uniref:Uncharacterized protein n=1 Tax=Mucilaginibacter pallidiroseus TaxID=2599295 RepID=A0A563UJW9_9SPHI|nr:hypothetical protein [Mucilaginibacter pallidiroseus]TWR31568.1 hypothetical protein FPZ43_03595 [Mucilaginibacter pallidiroseus]
MDYYREFSQVRTNELSIVRHKFFMPYYELTDGQFVYGKLSYKNNFKRYAIIETAQGSWTIKQKGWFKRALLINEGDDHTIGTLNPATWKRDMALAMNNGFEANYEYKKVFSKSFSLTSTAHGDILELTQHAFKIKQPYTVNFQQALNIDGIPPIPLLTLIGLHIVLLRAQQAAAH